jgi:oligopeptide/dipeptide ABC transporter ATP-binding protein
VVALSAGENNAAPEAVRGGPAAVDGEPLLVVEDLTIEVQTPEGPAEAVAGISLEVAAGRVTALVGESGSGKSLTALSILGLLPPAARVNRGRIRLGGLDLIRLGRRAMRSVRGGEVGMIFQEPMTALNPVMRVGDQVAEAVRAHTSASARAARARAEALFREVGIPEPRARLRAYPFELSGGMKQRVCIAIALAAYPKLLIADEPTTALDVTVQAQVLELLRTLGHTQGLGVLLITHDLGVVAEIADDVAVMYLGRIVERAPVASLFERPLHPYTQGLFRAVPKLGERRDRLDAVPGTVPPLSAIPSGCRFRTRCPLAETRCGEAEPPERRVGAGRMAACVLVEEAPGVSARERGRQ